MTSQLYIYVASSWRNEHQIEVVAALRADGHEVYDFKDSDGFHWSEVDPDWQAWPSDVPKYINGLTHEAAKRGFVRDMTALRKADVCVYVMPCGVSASFQAGWAVGQGKPTFVYVPELREPDLMVKMASFVTISLPEILAAVRDCERCLHPAADASERCMVMRKNHGPDSWIESRHPFDGPRERSVRYSSTT